MGVLVLALRGAAAVAVLTTLVGGIPRLVQAGLAIVVGVWCALAVGALPAATEPLLVVGARELVVGATLGVLAALPLLALATAGRLVDASASAAARGPYATLFGVLGAAVFVGIDGHVAVIAAITDSYHATSSTNPVAALGALIPDAVRLAIPWLITAAVVQVAAGVGGRLAARASTHVPLGAATPAALMMMTATLVGTLAVAIAGLVRNGFSG